MSTITSQGGVVIGLKKEGNKERIYYVGEDSHLLCIGATRSGKTRCLVIQSICALGLAGESIVISDPKAELFHYTSTFLEKLGYEVLTLDFKNPSKSQRYNPLQPIINAVNEGDTDKAEMLAWDLTNSLVGKPEGEKIWTNGECSIIAASILCVVCDNKHRPEYQNLTNVYWFIAEMVKTIGNKMPLLEYVKKLPSSHPAKALLSISDVAPSRTRGSFYTSALTTLRLFTSKSIYAITHKSDFQLQDIGQKRQALFIILPDEKTTFYPVASLVVSQQYELLANLADSRGGRLLQRVNFMLEEFGNFTTITDFTNKLTVGGGRGIRFNLFIQSFSQLKEKYDENTSDTIKANCQTWVYLQADDMDTLRELSEKLGTYTVSSYQLSANHAKFTTPSSSHSISLIERKLLNVDEIRRIRRPYQIVTSRTHPAIMYSPDLSEWHFNKMLGLGDKEHNRRLREEREKSRPVITDMHEEIALWKYMTVVSGVNLAETLFNVTFGFGVSLIVLKFLKKGFEIYVMWTDGDADEEPLYLLTNFLRALAVAICFPTLYGWLGGIVEDMTNQILAAIGVATDFDWQAWVTGISSLGLVTAIFGLIFLICYFMLYFQFLMRGLEILILRIGIPMACVGLLDNDKGVFKSYINKFFQSTLAIVLQISLAKLGVGLMINMHIFWGVACMVLAIKTPKFLQEFLITTGGGGTGVINNIYHSVRLVGMAKNLAK